MKALLIYPEFPKNTFWRFQYSLSLISKKAASPPLGLLTMASLLPKEWEIKLIDINVEKLKDKHIKWTDIVFISAMLIQEKSTKEIIQLCRHYGKKIVAGGPAFTALKKDFALVDHYVLNEAELTLPLFLKDLKEGKTKEYYTSTKKINIEKIPLPFWSLINHKKYASMAVQYSKGCPFNCDFCSITTMDGHISRTKTPQQMTEELDAIYNFGFRGSVFIVDDNFIGNKKNVKLMLKELIQWQKQHNYPFTFFTEASINLAKEHDLMCLMRLSNFYKVIIGIETTNIKSLRECGKLQNVNININKAVQTIQENGLEVTAGFIVGFDNDTKEVFDSLIEFIQNSNIITAMVGILNAVPGTELYKRLKKEGRILQHSSGENTDCSINFLPKMDVKELIDGYKKIVSTIYSRKYCYKRIKNFIKTHQSTTKTKLTLTDIKAFIRTTWRIGIFSNSRLSYWPLIIKTNKLHLSVRLIIIGEDLIRTTKKI